MTNGREYHEKKEIATTIIIMVVFIVAGLFFAYFTHKYLLYIPSSIVMGGVLSVAINRNSKK